MIKIEYDLKNEMKGKEPKDWGNGYYLCKFIPEKRICIVCKSGEMLHFHFGNSIDIGHNSDNYGCFYDSFELIGKIKDLKISDIVLE